MTDKEAKQLLKQLKEHQKEVLSSKENAIAALERAGLIKNGKATKPYRRSLEKT